MSLRQALHLNRQAGIYDLAVMLGVGHVSPEEGDSLNNLK